MSSVHGRGKPPLSRGDEDRRISLLFLSGAFFLGLLCGALFAASVSGRGNTALFSYITSFFMAAQSGSLEMPGVFSAGWTVFRWPLFVILLGCTAFRAIGIPIVFFLRGFLLCFAVSAFVLVLGRSGALFAFLLLGIGSLVSVPALFLLGTEVLTLSVQEGQKRGKRLLQQYMQPAMTLRGILFTIAFGLATVWEAWFLPFAINQAAQWFVL